MTGAGRIGLQTEEQLLEDDGGGGGGWGEWKRKAGLQGFHCARQGNISPREEVLRVEKQQERGRSRRRAA
jgi:hypothetical protein